LQNLQYTVQQVAYSNYCTSVKTSKTGIVSFSAGCNLVITATTQYALHITSCIIVLSY